MNVFGYVRVSTEHQAEDGVSLAEQQRRIEGQALVEGWQLTAIFVERAVSGSVPLAERPEGGRLLAQARAGDIVIAAKLDRMFRSALDALTVIKDFQARGVHLYLMDIGGDVSGNGIAKLMLTMVSAFAEFERDRISERIRDARRQMRAEGKTQGGSRPFGWQVAADGTMVADPREQAAIAMMKALHAEGKSLRQIALEIDSRGLPMTHTTVRRVLARQNLGAGDEPPPKQP